MEEVKRLPPKSEVLRRLYTVSGNQCSFPGCNRPMFNNEGNFVGQVCHIEAAMPGGERFNPLMTNEQRRSFENLMLMCYDHHIETDKEDYSADKLKKFKSDHEKRFTDIDGMINLMHESIIDVTSSEKANDIENLQALNVDSSGNSFEEPFEDDDIKAFNAMIRVFESLSPQARKTFAISLSRSKYEKNFLGRDSDKLYFDPREIERVTEKNLKSIYSELEINDLIYLDEIDIGNDRIEHNYVVYFKNSEVNFWDSIRLYCENKNLDIVDIVTFMKFTVFDQ